MSKPNFFLDTFYDSYNKTKAAIFAFPLRGQLKKKKKEIKV